MSDWGSRARIKELEDEVKRLKAQLKVSGELAFKAGYVDGFTDMSPRTEDAWAAYTRRIA